VQRAPRDIFEKARLWAVTLMMAAGLVAIVGSTLDWVTITPPPRNPEGIDFGNEDFEPSKVSVPFSGLEAGDGWWTLGAGVVLVTCGLLLFGTRRGGWAWLGLPASIVLGAVAIADYRGIGDLSSSISQRMDVVGRADPAAGIILVVGAALAGLIGSVVGITASPQRHGAHSPT
jgi:hypothetical protein